MALLSTPLGLKIVGDECGVDFDFWTMPSPRPEAVIFSFSMRKHYHHEVGRRLLVQQQLPNIPSFSLRLDTLMDSFRSGRAIDLMFRRLEFLLGFAAVCHQLHERFLRFFVQVIAEHRGIVGPHGGVRFHSFVDLHFDVEPQVLLLLDSRLFLMSSAGHYEQIEYEEDDSDYDEDDSDYEEEDDAPDYYYSESDDDEDAQGQTEAETEGGFGDIAASEVAIAKLERMNSDCVGALDEGCSICFDDFEETDSDWARLPCSHVFHYHCIAQWLERSRTCPLCRLDVN